MKETNVIEQPVMGSSELTQALDHSQNDLSRNLWPWLVVWLGFEPMTTHLAGQHCSKWANQVGFLGYDRVWVILHTIEPESHFPFVCFYHILTSSVIYNNGEFKMSLWRGKWEPEKSNRFREAKQQLACASCFFVLFLAVTAWLRHELNNFTFYWQRKRMRTNSSFSL